MTSGLVVDSSNRACGAGRQARIDHGLRLGRTLAVAANGGHEVAAIERVELHRRARADRGRPGYIAQQRDLPERIAVREDLEQVPIPDHLDLPGDDHVEAPSHLTLLDHPLARCSRLLTHVTGEVL